MAQDVITIPFVADLFRRSIKADLASQGGKSTIWDFYPAQTDRSVEISSADSLTVLTPVVTTSSTADARGVTSTWTKSLDEKLDKLSDVLSGESGGVVDEAAFNTLCSAVNNARSFSFEFFGPSTPTPAVIVNDDGTVEMIWRLSGWTLEVSFDGSTVFVWARNRRSTELWSGSTDETSQVLSALLQSFAKASARI